MILCVTLIVQILVHGLQFGLGIFINGVDSAPDYPDGALDAGDVVARRLVYGGQRNASKLCYKQCTYCDGISILGI